jgi:hypothetical protein
MHRLPLLAVAVAALVSWNAPQGVAQEPATVATPIETWVAELGADDFTTRQAAADQLLGQGFAARNALLAVAEGPDPEIRAAARRLILLIDQSEFSRRLTEFAADVDGKRGATLPGWEQFSELVGHDSDARALFVEMHREEAPLLTQYFEPGPIGAAPVNWDERIIRLHNWQIFSRQRGNRPPLGSYASMYFLASLPESQVSDMALHNLCRLAQQAPVNELLQSTRGQPAMRRLVSAWLVNSPSRNEAVLNDQLTIMTAYELQDALPFAVGIARGDARYVLSNPHGRAEAALAVGKFGTEKDVATLEPLLVNKTELLPQPPPLPGQGQAYSVQLRDVALATLLHLTDQDLKDYGFMRARRQPDKLFDVRSLGMESDERREAAAAQWREWKSAQE